VLSFELAIGDTVARALQSRGNDRKFFDLDNHPFKESIDDPDIIQAFKEKCAELRDGRDPAAILLSIANTHGWSDADIGTLSALSIDEYYKIFKEGEGPELRTVIDTCLQFDRIASPSSPMSEISKRAKEALQRIGRESPINALRLRKYGIEIVKSGGDPAT
jgi:hypothetical protein